MSTPSPILQPLPVIPCGVTPREAGGRPRIGLISPYMGSNLGDTAILESTMAQLKGLFPAARFLLIVLDCARASYIHGVDSFPLAAVSRGTYVQSAAPSPGRPVLSAETPRPCSSRAFCVMKGAMSHVPFFLGAARRVRDRFRTIGREARHILDARGVVLRLDALVVAGGGQLDDEAGGPFSHPYALFKWVSLARKHGVPVFFAGVGIDDLRHPLSNWFLRRVLSKAQRVSLRDPGSAGILRSMGVRRELLLCPDMAFGLRLVPDGAAPLPVSTRPTVGLSPIAFGHPSRWPTVKTEIFQRYWHQFKAFAASLLAEGLSLKFFVTDDADYLLVEALREELTLMAPDPERLQFLPFMRLPQLAATLQSCDAVVASRLHGVLLSHICRVPVLAVSYRRKVSVYMESMEQEKFCLDLETFTAPAGVEALRGLLAQRHETAAALRRTCEEKFRGVTGEFSHIGADMARKMESTLPTSVRQGGVRI